MLSRLLLVTLSCSSIYAFAAAPSPSNTCPPSHSKKPAPPQPVPRYDNNVFITADFIYWLAKQEGNEFASTGTAITVPDTVDPNTGLTASSVSQGTVYAPSPKMKPGFKVGIGLNLAHDAWDLFSEYTYLHSKADRSVSSDDVNAGILPVFSYSPNNSILSETTYATPIGALGFVSNASASWSLHFNNVNLEMGKDIKISPNFRLHPHFGFQGSWQKQEFKTHYVVSSLTDATVELGSNVVSYTQDFWGVGLRAGIDSTWQCCKHFGLFGNSGLSALWSGFKGHARSYDTNFGAGYENVLISSQRNRPYTLSPVAQIEVGAQSDWIFNDKYRFLMQASWEGQIWFFQNQHSTAIADTSLILQGLTVSFRFDF